ncbi:MAG: transporter substrate-binding domain-containing protein [Anaerolineales bacterium]
MKKFTFVLSVLVLATLVLTACAPKATGGTGGGSAAAGMTDLKGRTITVAVENAYPPFNSIDEGTSQGVGWDYDAVTEICRRLNCVPEFKEVAWDGLFPAMNAGEYDMAADGITYKRLRAWGVDFSIPYTPVSQALLVRADETHTLDEFKTDQNLKVGTQIQTTNYDAAVSIFPDKEIVAFEDFGAPVLALLSGDIDGVVIDDVAAYGFMEANPDQMKVISYFETGEFLAFVYPPGSDLINPINAALRAMMADGTLAQLNAQWGLADPGALDYK